MNTLKIDNDILINTCSNFEKDSKDILLSTDINFIQFHFCLQGKISLNYNNGAYTFNLLENNSIILFNPSTNLPIDGSLGEKTKYVSLLITIKKFVYISIFTFNFILLILLIVFFFIQFL